MMHKNGIHMFLDSVHDAHAHVSDCDRFFCLNVVHIAPFSGLLTVLYCRTNSSAA